MGEVTRRRCGRGFAYHDAAGRLIRDQERLQRYRSLAVPPAWHDVRISDNPRARILATGYDDRGRRQYIYNPRFRQRREAAKYGALSEFAAVLPRIRSRILSDIRNAPQERWRVAALCARLIDKAGIRAGSRAYRREYGTYGATTLLKRHVVLSDQTIRLKFTAKGGRRCSVRLRDAVLAEGLRELLRTPGSDLFRYRSATGRWVTLSTATLNAYLHSRGGSTLTAKAFRTWKATVVVAEELADSGPGTPLTPALEKAAESLGNTPATVRGSYLHPEIIEAHHAGALSEAARQAAGRPHMPSGEQAVADLLATERDSGD